MVRSAGREISGPGHVGGGRCAFSTTGECSRGWIGLWSVAGTGHQPGSVQIGCAPRAAESGRWCAGWCGSVPGASVGAGSFQPRSSARPARRGPVTAVVITTADTIVTGYGLGEFGHLECVIWSDGRWLPACWVARVRVEARDVRDRGASVPAVDARRPWARPRGSSGATVRRPSHLGPSGEQAAEGPCEASPRPGDS